MKKSNVHPAIPEKIIMVHTFAILAVCIIFGVISIISATLVKGLIIIGCGAAATVLSFILKKKVAPTTRGFVLSILQLGIIILLSATTQTMQDMFPLMLASLAIAAIYYNKACIITHWAVMDAAAIAGLIFRDFFYGNADIVGLIKGIAGINIGAFLIMYLLNCSLNFITQAEEAKASAGELLDRVKEQMEETERMAEAQKAVVQEIASVSHTLNLSGEKMNQVAANINQAAEEQQTTITEIAEDISNITAETQRSLDSAEAASKAAAESTHLLSLSNEEINKMMSAMAEIEESSDQIRNIVKTIEDIAFQT
ncbi:MAG: methyl-accepting chemotaxis protein, partial [Oscillospiraceae bacterium]|nr:methyl-accepting chemotaxis protein [Oscillospiraceae bacterium]